MKDFEKKLNIRFNQGLQKMKEALNKCFEEEGKDIRITVLEGATAEGRKGIVTITKVKEV